MAIYDPNVVRRDSQPPEDNPPLVVNPDGVKVPQLAGQLLQAIGGRDPRVLQPAGGINCDQLAPGHAGVTLEVADNLIAEQCRSPLVTVGTGRGMNIPYTGVQSSLGLDGERAD